MTDTPSLIAAYSAAFNARYLRGHSVASALGLWLLLALAAPTTTGNARARLEAELGTDADDAAARAAELLSDPHPAVLAAVAVWARSTKVNPTFAPWAASLPPAVETGEMPTKSEADAWARERTAGLIAEFPVDLNDAALVLASALATVVSWSDPFLPLPATELGGEFGASITVALRAPSTHWSHLVDTDAAGLVGAHAADSDAGLRVISVITDREVSPDRAHRAALQVASILDRRPDGAREADLFDLPLGEGPAWTVTEREYQGDGPERWQHVTSYLAAWSADGDHDLSQDPGARAAADGMGSLLAPGVVTGVLAARQVAIAQYTRTGFRAAALTAMAVGASMRRGTHRVVVREATVRFNRPYAALAVATGHGRGIDGSAMVIPAPKWLRIPVFSAWVARVDNTADRDDSPFD